MHLFNVGVDLKISTFDILWERDMSSGVFAFHKFNIRTFFTQMKSFIYNGNIGPMEHVKLFKLLLALFASKTFINILV